MHIKTFIDRLEEISTELTQGENYWDEQCIQQRNYADGVQETLTRLLGVLGEHYILSPRFIDETLEAIGPY